MIFKVCNGLYAYTKNMYILRTYYYDFIMYQYLFKHTIWIQCRNVRTWVVFGLNDRRQGLVERQEAWQDKLNLLGVEYRRISL